VRWTQIVENIWADGYTLYLELGPGEVLQGLIRKILPSVEVESKATF
jgi:[acyl-carrier-protein] S-malonyltransferase